MKSFARLTVVMSVIFAVTCFGVAIKGWSATGEMTDPVQVADSRGFAGFWAFLGGVAAVMGVVSEWMARTGKDAQ